MAYKRGFTLIEMKVVLCIVGVLAAMLIPKFIITIEQEKAATAKNNLLAISVAESKFNEDYGGYCISVGNPNPSGTTNCGDSVNDLNSNLHLNMATTGNSFTYVCAGTPYLCTVTDGTVTLTSSGAGVNCTVGGADCPP